VARITFTILEVDRHELCGALCGRPLPASADNWTCGLQLADILALQSAIPSLHRVVRKLISCPAEGRRLSWPVHASYCLCWGADDELEEVDVVSVSSWGSDVQAAVEPSSHPLLSAVVRRQMVLPAAGSMSAQVAAMHNYSSTRGCRPTSAGSYARSTATPVYVQPPTSQTTSYYSPAAKYVLLTRPRLVLVITLS